MKKLLVAALLLPVTAFAQGAGAGQGAGPGKGRWKDDPRAAERMERRMHLARTLGLAEALDLEPKKALELGDVIARFDARRDAARKQMREAHDALRKAAGSDKPTAQEVDQAIQRGQDARAQMAQIDKETLQAVVKDLNPEQRARAVLFLDRFQRRFAFGRGGGDGEMGERIHRVMRQRMGPGGMGPGGMGPGGAGGPGAEAGPGRPGHAMAFAFGGPGRGGMAFTREDEDTFFFEPDTAFDDDFDVQVEVEDGD